MPSTFSTSLRIELIGEGEQSGVWGTTTNNNLGDLIEQAITGTTNLNVTAGNITLTSLNGLVDEARSATLYVFGTPGVTRVLTIPNVYKNYTVQNVTANIVQVKTASGTAFDCPPLSHSYINCDESNVVTGRSITTGANTITSSAAPFNSPAFTGVPTAPTATSGTNTTQLATTAFVTTAVAAGIPVGVITMWSGSIASIPAGWALCNGTSGTPDLRDRFIVGAGSTYAVAATGGANTITLDTTQIPSHTHTGTTNATDLSHTHTGSGTTSDSDLNHNHTGSGTTGFTDLSHSHTVTINATNVDHVHNVQGTTNVQNANHGHSGATDTQGSHSHSYNTVSGSSGSIDDGQISPPQTGVVAATTAVAGAHNHNVSTGIQNADHGHFLNLNSGGMSANASHTHSNSVSTASQNHVHSYSFTTSTTTTLNHSHTYSFTTSGASVGMNHTHTFTTAGTGGGAAHENRPPYYALAYIMKV